MDVQVADPASKTHRRLDQSTTGDAPSLYADFGCIKIVDTFCGADLT